MPRTEKIERVAALKERIEGADALLLTEYRGLTVSEITELRKLRTAVPRFAVVKNTLMRRAPRADGAAELGVVVRRSQGGGLRPGATPSPRRRA